MQQVIDSYVSEDEEEEEESSSGEGEEDENQSSDEDSGDNANIDDGESDNDDDHDSDGPAGGVQGVDVSREEVNVSSLVQSVVHSIFSSSPPFTNIEDTQFVDPTTVSPSSPPVLTDTPSQPSSSGLSTGPSSIALDTHIITTAELSHFPIVTTEDDTLSPPRAAMVMEPPYVEGESLPMDYIPISPVSVSSQQDIGVNIGDKQLSEGSSQQGLLIERQTSSPGHTVSTLSLPHPSTSSQQFVVVTQGTPMESSQLQSHICFPFSLSSIFTPLPTQPVYSFGPSQPLAQGSISDPNEAEVPHHTTAEGSTTSTLLRTLFGSPPPSPPPSPSNPLLVAIEALTNSVNGLRADVSTLSHNLQTYQTNTNETLANLTAQIQHLFTLYSQTQSHTKPLPSPSPSQSQIQSYNPPQPSLDPLLIRLVQKLLQTMESHSSSLD